MRRCLSANLTLALLALTFVGALVGIGPALASGEVAPVAPSVPVRPGNDSLVNAQTIRSLPATIEGTTVGATLEPNERESDCSVSTDDSVWYALRLPSTHRVAINLKAAGSLDATIDVYHAIRSELAPVGCQRTDSKGKASISFNASKNGLYDIRVAALAGSQLAAFTLEAFTPTPAVRPPGARLSPAGASGRVDRIQNINAAYSFEMHAGVSYMLSLANETSGACVTGRLFSPGTHSFGDGEEAGASALFHIECGGFKLFTPGPGAGGLYSFEVTPRKNYLGIQRFHFQIGEAGPTETAPGLLLANYAKAHGSLSARSTHVLRLYRINVATHSNLDLELSAPESADFKLQLRDASGKVIECGCEGVGAERVQRQLNPGTYYAAVSVAGDSSGHYVLTRKSRTITKTEVSFEGSGVSPGTPTAIAVKISPAVSGPVRVEVERFDPVFGWQFYKEDRAFAGEGSASISFAPPTVGLWKARASFEGSRTASPSEAGYTYLHVK